jgi:hypothetical protein
VGRFEQSYVALTRPTDWPARHRYEVAHELDGGAEIDLF